MLATIIGLGIALSGAVDSNGNEIFPAGTYPTYAGSNDIDPTKE